jgi:hypothetical protein
VKEASNKQSNKNYDKLMLGSAPELSNLLANNAAAKLAAIGTASAPPLNNSVGKS